MSDGTDHDECRRSIGDGIRKLKVATAQLTEANATIAALRAHVEALDTQLVRLGDGEWVEGYQMKTGAWHRILALVRQPLPPAAAKLLESANNEQAAYAERTHVVALLARVFPAGIRQTNIEGWAAEWNGCVFIDLPTGQISYHYHDSLAWLFAGLPAYTAEWDGHDKALVWERQRATYPAAAKLLAERDAGRALFRALEDIRASYTDSFHGDVAEALEAYRKVVE